MTCSSRRASRRHRKWHRSSGNTAFDAYRDETLKRLEEEQTDFHAFLDRLRSARDQSEFDQFMDEQTRRAAEASRAPDAPENGGAAA